MRKWERATAEILEVARGERSGGFSTKEVITGAHERAPREPNPQKTIAGGCMTEERILGKFFRPTREWPSPGAESALVTKTWPPLLGIALGNALCGEGEVIANAALCRKKG